MLGSFFTRAGIRYSIEKSIEQPETDILMVPDNSSPLVAKFLSVAE
jgi:hypothetical protein